MSNRTTPHPTGALRPRSAGVDTFPAVAGSGETDDLLAWFMRVNQTITGVPLRTRSDSCYFTLPPCAARVEPSQLPLPTIGLSIWSTPGAHSTEDIFNYRARLLYSGVYIDWPVPWFAARSTWLFDSNDLIQNARRDYANTATSDSACKPG